MKLKSVALIYNPTGGSAKVGPLNVALNALTWLPIAALLGVIVSAIFGTGFLSTAGVFFLLMAGATVLRYMFANRPTVQGLIEALEARGYKVHLKPTTAEHGSARKLAAEVASLVDLVIALGGDGTASGVAEGLMGTNTPMAVYPGGTGNLFARSFHSVPTPELFARMLETGDPQPVDVIAAEYSKDGKEERVLVLVAMGVGRISDAISHASPFWKRLFKQLAYAYRVFLACLNPQAHKVELRTASGVRIHDAAAVFVLNVTPPEMTMLSRGCSACDGLMDVVILNATNFWQLAKASLWFLLMQPEHSPHYARYRVKEARLISARPVTLNIDGDVGATVDEMNLKVLQGCVNMILA